jgi:CRISPR system Cascade subunit CasB
VTLTAPPRKPPDSPTDADRPASRDELLVRHVHAKVTSLQAAFLNDSATATASLAKLRRAVNAGPGTDPGVWFETLDGVPASLLGRDDAPSPYETAIHASVTLHAIHQQSQRVRMHQLGYPLGRAVRLLTKRVSGDVPGNDSPVMRRFHALATASSLPETTHHLRGLVTQLRGEAIPLDYGLLARDLRRLQHQRTAPGVRLQWGRDYHRLGSDPGQTGETADRNDAAETTDPSTGDPE